MKKLRIATMITGRYTCPPPKGVIYAPMLIAKAIVEGLVKRGHKVFFFGPEGSNLKVTKIISGGMNPLYGKKEHQILQGPMIREKEREKIKNLWDQYLISLIYQEALKGKYDLIHIHPVDRVLPFSLAFENIPVVYTLHDPIYPWRRDIFRMFQSKNQYFVSISNAQRKPAPYLNWVATIYNGIDLKYFPFKQKPKNQTLFLGRILPTKGTDIAIKAAKLAKVKLIIAGSPNRGDFWKNKIKPFLGKNIQYIGNVPYQKTYKYYGESKVSLFPIQWEEPFGLTFVESMACGTPVIAFDRGSAKEVIKDGETGFVVKNLREMVKAIKKIEQIDRKKCRTWVEKNFPIEKMVDNYERIFFKILKKKIK